MKAAIIAGCAVLFLATGAAHAQWTEADGKDTIFIAWKSVRCDGIKLTLWKPYNLKEKKNLNFWRITANPPNAPVAHLKGKITIGEVDAFPDVFIDGERCLDDNPKGN